MKEFDYAQGQVLLNVTLSKVSAVEAVEYVLEAR